MTFAPVGLRCPDHAASGGKPQGVQRRAQRAVRRTTTVRGHDAIVTKILVAINVVVFLITVAQGSGLNSPGGPLFNNWALFGGRGIIDGHVYGGVAGGDWWRLITSAFLHGSLVHIAFNMLALWWLGAPVELALGRARYLGLYLVSGLAGAAGALVANPNALTVGASGAIFGLLGAGVVLEWQATGSPFGNYLMLIVINLAISFAVPNISVGGHIGGLIGGILCTLAFTKFGRAHAAYSRLSPIGAVTLAVVAAGAVLVAYLKTRGMA